MRIRNGDDVQVINGDDNGKIGKIKSVNIKSKRVVIEGMNLVVKHLKPSQKNPKGGRIQMEASIASSNVLPICKNKSCAKHNKGVRVKMKILNNSEKIRACVKCDHEISNNE